LRFGGFRCALAPFPEKKGKGIMPHLASVTGKGGKKNQIVDRSPVERK